MGLIKHLLFWPVTGPLFLTEFSMNKVQGVVREGTGVRIGAQYGGRGDLAGKTGTTQNAADTWWQGWTCGLTSGATC